MDEVGLRGHAIASVSVMLSSAPRLLTHSIRSKPLYTSSCANVLRTSSISPRINHPFRRYSSRTMSAQEITEVRTTMSLASRYPTNSALGAQNEIGSHKITIFTRSWCPYCRAVTSLFSSEFPEEAPHIVELESRSDGDAIQSYLAQKTGQTSVPNVFINGKQIGGNDKTQALFRSGELSQLLSA
ncbi:unnamed protein product [Mycena citricolor]|uniref:Glutaredoxin domain-containing protein n=1 Tax=Mycena citricolor TaxID=2018698 RepID=A0AAD2JYD4_9AGAR|nr:unnamed protein product [Mycena citricolor]